jgi:hypothetical protein
VQASSTKITAKVSVTAKVPLGPLSVSMAKAQGRVVKGSSLIARGGE